MRLSEFFEHYNLHDSVAEALRFVPAEQLLTMNLELCNFMQQSFREGDPEIIGGQLTFRGVDKVEAVPDLSLFSMETDAQILEAGPISTGTAVPIKVRMVLESADYKNKRSQWFALEFPTSDVEWKPDSVTEPEL